MNQAIIVSEMTTGYARLISTWAYDDMYAVYNHDDGFIDECMDGMHFAFTNRDGMLLGYFCFGKEARIPTIEENAYDDNFLDIGLHMHPDLIGKKRGSLFLNICLDYARKNFNTNYFRATIASFNERAINLCLKSGFYSQKIVTHRLTKKKFVVICSPHKSSDNGGLCGNKKKK
ncbi:MAG: GNAT family N-acetyltransferase [Defluviitaleaceae bacterium]|nr:GNAT family N-acetyltransferase [Defluviitaleaceae bacterium]